MHFLSFFQVEFKICFCCVVAASTTAASLLVQQAVATLHKTLPRDLQRVSLEWVWWVNFGSTSFLFFCNQFKSSVMCFTRLSGVMQERKVACIQYSKCLVLQSLTEFPWLWSVPYFGLCLVFNAWFGSLKYIAILPDHIAAGTCTVRPASIYNATTRRSTTGRATTLEDEFVWLDRIEEGRVEILYWLEREGQFRFSSFFFFNKGSY